MVETGKDYAMKNKFSSLKIHESMIFGAIHHKDKQWVQDFVVEKACDMSKQEGRVEGEIKGLRFVLDMIDTYWIDTFISQDKDLKEEIEKRLVELEKGGKK